MKNIYKKVQLRVPFLKKDISEGEQVQALHEKDCLHMKDQLLLDHEQFRRDYWEPLKHFRTRYDSEKVLTENILEPSDITSKKRSLDKLVMENIRVAIMSDDH